MGLDIDWYSEIQEMGEVNPDLDLEPNQFRVYAHPSFPGREAPLKDGMVYRAKAAGHFRAGSYSGYNEWREQLAKMARYPLVAASRPVKGMRHDEGAWNADGGPFWELINFADNEGVIGSVAAAKLANDFAEWQERAEKIGNGGLGGIDYWMQNYANFRNAFEQASNNGAVVFR